MYLINYGNHPIDREKCMNLEGKETCWSSVLEKARSEGLYLEGGTRGFALDRAVGRSFTVTR